MKGAGAAHFEAHRLVFVALLAIAVMALVSHKVEHGVFVTAIIMYLGCAMLVYRANGRMRALISPYVFVFLYSIYVFFPALAGFVLLPRGMQERTHIFKDDGILLAVVMGLVCFTGGVLIAKELWGPQLKTKLRTYRARPLLDNLRVHFWIPAFFLIITSIGLTVWFYATCFDVITIMFAEGLVSDEARLSLRPGHGLFVINFVYILPAMSLLAMLKWKASGRRAGMTMKLATSLLVSFCFLSLMFFLFRGNILFYFLLLLMTTQSITFRPSRRSLVLVASCTLVALLIISVLRAGVTEDAWEVFRLVGEKIGERFVTPVEQLGHVLDTFPRRGFLPGKTFLMDLLALGPGADVGFNGLLYEEMGYYGTGTATVTILGELFANLGYAGIALGMLFLGMSMQCLHIWLLTSRKTILNVFIYVVSSIYISKTVIAGIGENLFPVLLVYFPLMGTLWVFSRTLKIRPGKFSSVGPNEPEGEKTAYA